MMNITRNCKTMVPIQALGNCILTQLPADVWTHWQVHFEELALPEGRILCEPGQALTHVYFPTTAIVSWQYLLASGECTEIAMVGKEGLVGLDLLMGAMHSNNQAVVQTAGHCIRIKLDVVLRSFQQNQTAQSLIMLYAGALIAQMSHGNVCRQHHTLEQQLSRMILMVLDRQQALHMHKTHEGMAQALGVRRESVSLAAAKLMKEGFISYSRGHLEVLDRAGLMQRSCECYQLLQQLRCKEFCVKGAVIKPKPSDCGWHSGSNQPPYAGLLCA
jgi:CRP-like cAMP-binding protein